MKHSYERWALLPVAVSFVYSLCGFSKFGWRVADLSFWFWFDYVLSGITALGLALPWSRAHSEVSRSQRTLMLFLLLFVFGIILFFASLFFGLAYYH